jgi:hypothetical protein
MNKKIRFSLRAVMVFLVLPVLVAACATTGKQRATRASTSIDSVEMDYIQMDAQIDKNKESLEALMMPSQLNIKNAYGVFADDVNATEQLATRLYKHTEEMATRGDEYFSEWERAYTNVDIQALSEQRRIRMKEVYAQIPAASVGARGALETYVSDIREIQRYLSNDLTPQGIAAIGSIAERAVKDGEIVQKRIRDVLISIGRVKGEMTQGGSKQ